MNKNNPFSLNYSRKNKLYIIELIRKVVNYGIFFLDIGKYSMGIILLYNNPNRKI